MKHGLELVKMESPAHKVLVPLAETTLAILRLSCEQFFMLISVFVAYLLFWSHVPQWLRAVIRLNHRLSKAFQKASQALPMTCSSMAKRLWLKSVQEQGQSSASVTALFAPAPKTYHRLSSIPACQELM